MRASLVGRLGDRGTSDWRRLARTLVRRRLLLAGPAVFVAALAVVAWLAVNW
ncbi:hypothetical protein ACWKT5_39895 [Streptomyces avermitilis]